MPVTRTKQDELNIQSTYLTKITEIAMRKGPSQHHLTSTEVKKCVNDMCREKMSTSYKVVNKPLWELYVHVGIWA